jgi:acyl dehydratase
VIEISDIHALASRTGHELAVSEWIEITQSMIDRFADATGDNQWIHVDAARAAAESPYGVPIAHGFLTLSLVPSMLRRTLVFPRVRMAVNYGLNRVRFMSAVPVGARIRGRFTPSALTPRGDGVDVTWSITIERDGGDKPCCVAEWIGRYFE